MFEWFIEIHFASIIFVYQNVRCLLVALEISTTCFCLYSKNTFVLMVYHCFM